MNKDPEMQGNTMQPNRKPEAAAETTPKGQEVVLGPKDNLVVAEATLETNLPDGTTFETTVVPKKKKHTGLIAVVVAAIVVFLLSVGFGLWYFLCYNNPERIAYDAMTQFFSAEHVQAEGVITYKAYDEESNTHYTYEFALDNKSSTLPNATTLKLTIKEDDHIGGVLDDLAITINLGSAIMSDGVIYFQAANLMDALEEISADGSDFESELGQAVYDIIEIIDGEWWRISIPEIVDQLQLGSSAQPIKDLYSCVVAAAGKNRSGELATLYREHPFASVVVDEATSTTQGITQYGVNLNYDNLATFINTLPNTSASTEVIACYNSYAKATDGQSVSVEDFGEITADDIRNQLPDDFKLRFNIFNNTHQLHDVMFGYGDDDNHLIGYLSFTYEPAEVSAPESYRSVDELVEDVMDVVMQFLNSQFGDDYEYDPDQPFLDDDTLDSLEDGSWSA